MTRLVSVVLPVYDEHDSIAACLRGLAAALTGCAHEIVVVYDRDEDTTLPAIAAMPDAPASLRLVRNDLGRGAANALRAGFAAARGDVVVTSMADLSDPPELIPLLAERVRAGAAVVSGSRYMPGGSQQGGPRLKVLLSRLAGRSLRVVAGMGTSDATSNFRAYETAFLRATEVESDAGFEIALELTVKAHLAGREVAELPSSWRDRSHGQSRFRLWRWLPGYLRWYARAMAAPLAAFGAALVLGVWALVAALDPGGERATLSCARAALLVAGAGAALGLARAARGRLRALDVAHPLAWLVPWLATLGARGAWPTALALGAAASTLLLTVVPGAPGARACGRALARLRPRRPGVALLLVLLTLVFWAARLSFAEPSGGVGPDPSWQQAIAYALMHGVRWGEDIVFTYGPLGAFAVPRYEPGLYWAQALVWEVGVELVVAVFLTLGVLRIRGSVGRVAFVSVVLLGSGRTDTDAFMAVLAAGSWLLARPAQGARPLLGTLAALGLLAAFALVKFTALTLAVVPIALAVLLAMLMPVLPDGRRSVRAGLALALLALAAFVALWLVAGQTLAGLWPHLRGSIWIARGYQASMGLDGASADLRLALFAGLPALALLALETLPRPRSLARVAQALLVAAAVCLAAKSAFVRHDGVSGEELFAVLGAAVWLGPQRARGEQRELAAVATFGRLAVSGLCLVALAGDANPAALQVLARRGLLRARAELATLTHLDAHQADLVARRARNRRALALPAVRERVGDATVDVFSNQQGVLLANGLRWHPRPAFQSYFAYGPELARANARFMAGPDAPRYALFRFSDIDDRLPTVADGPALLVLLRDYAPVLSDGGYLLLERRPDAPLREPARRTLLELDAALGERVSLDALDTGLDTGPGGTGELWIAEVELAPSAFGRIASALTRTPPVRVELVLDPPRDGDARPADASGALSTTGRLLPELAPLGFPIRPVLLGQAEWQAAFEGRPQHGARALTINVAARHRSWFKEPVRVRIVALEGVLPREQRTFEDADLLFDPQPDTIDTPFGPLRRRLGGSEVYVVGAPSELRFALQPGAHTLAARFGIAPSSGVPDTPTAFTVLVREDGRERLLFERELAPRDTIGDRGLQTLELAVEVEVPADLVLRVRSTTQGSRSKGGVGAYWTNVRLR